MLCVLVGRCEIKFGLFLSSRPPSLPPVFLLSPSLAQLTLTSLIPFMCLSTCRNSRMDGRIFIAFCIWEFDEQLFESSHFGSNGRNVKGALQEVLEEYEFLSASLVHVSLYVIPRVKRKKGCGWACLF